MNEYTQKEFNTAKARDLLTLQCEHCNKFFQRTKRDILQRIVKLGRQKFCSRLCDKQSKNKSQVVACCNCGESFHKMPSQIKKSNNNFCSKSCATTYNNTHKTHGTRRSKLEVWLEQQLPSLYPSLEFHFNRKDAINAELDIYIPSLKLAFELNGLFHYEPIFGPEKLAQIQNNDERKHAACLERGIELCWIDTSALKYFKEKNIVKYLAVIQEVIDRKFVPQVGLEPTRALRPNRF